MKTNGIIASILFGVNIIAVLLFFLGIISKNILGNILIPSIIFLIVVHILSNFKKQKLLKKEQQQKKKEEKKQRKLERIRLNSMLETPLLIKSNQGDLILEPKIITEEQYEPFFAPFNSGCMIFPAIDESFEKSLKNYALKKVKIREFLMKKDGMSPIHYFDSFEKGDPTTISLSANQILDHFVSNIGHWKERNWYVLNTKPNEGPNIENLRIVDIHLIENADCGNNLNLNKKGKYFLYCHKYKEWRNSFTGNPGLKDKKSKFFVPVS